MPPTSLTAPWNGICARPAANTFPRCCSSAPSDKIRCLTSWPLLHRANVGLLNFHAGRHSRNVLRHAVSKRPILFLHFDQVDEHIFAPQFQPFMQAIGNGLVEALLCFRSPSRVQRDLDEDAIVCTLDSQVLRVVDQAGLLVFRDDLKLILLRHVQCFNHCAIHDLSHARPVICSFSLYKINSNQWHVSSNHFSFHSDNWEKIQSSLVDTFGKAEWTALVSELKRLGQCAGAASGR